MLSQLAKLLLQIREDLNLTQKELGNKLDISQASLSKMERDEVLPRHDAFMRIVNFANKHGYKTKGLFCDE